MSYIFIVEDEALVALDLKYIIEDTGLTPCGPYDTVVSSMEALDEHLPDCAILDVRVSDGEIFPVADRLMTEDVPIIFYSGHADKRMLTSRYPDAQICVKPSSPQELLQAISDTLGLSVV
ncbi:response regulator [Asaia astilbis]|uniref:response regulator n=1 Tax=Asaia astilbis TaxID=610244 RepID=UPI00046FA7E9|nr:response regulator [Asaia astilbis]